VEEKFYAVRKAHRKAEGSKSRRKKAFGEAQLAGPLTVDDNDDKCLDIGGDHDLRLHSGSLG
jgi:hypothetical protein